MAEAFNFAEMDQRITIKQEVRTADGAGGSTLTWADVCTTWAKVESLTGNEPYYDKQLMGTVAYKLTCRYRPDITSAMQIVWDGHTLLITAPPYDGENKKRTMTVMCTEKPATGT